eukprot:scaffold98294_cov63-Phaeocystis_antarctica.AAC.4
MAMGDICAHYDLPYRILRPIISDICAHCELVWGMSWPSCTAASARRTASTSSAGMFLYFIT